MATYPKRHHDALSVGTEMSAADALERLADDAPDTISAGVTDYLQKEVGTDQYAVLANRVANAARSRRDRQARRESEQRYRTLVGRSHDAIFVLREDRFAFVNDRLCELAGYDREDLERSVLYTS